MCDLHCMKTGQLLFPNIAHMYKADKLTQNAKSAIHTHNYRQLYYNFWDLHVFCFILKI